MAAEWPAFAVVVLCACAAPLFLLSDGVRAADDGVPAPSPPSAAAAAGWCLKKECKCATAAESAGDDDQRQRVAVKCRYAGDKNVIWEPDSGNKNLSKSLVSLELIGDGHGRLTVHGRTFATFARLRLFSVSGFAELTVKQHGLLVKNADLNFTLTIGRVRNVSLDTNAVQPTAGTVDALVEDCHTVRLSNEVVSKLRSFAFRRIESLELSKNTFKNAAEGSAIENMTLEDLKANRLPSHAFITTIDHLSITNCAFGAIERNAFPINSMMTATLTNVTVDRVESEAFQNSSLITSLRIIGCRIREMEKDAVMSVVQSIHIERSEFGWVRTWAVAVANELTLLNNTFDRVASRGFVLHNLHSARVDGNTFGRLDADAFFESTAAARQTRSVLRVRDNVFVRPPSAVDGKAWPTPAVRLQTAAIETDVAGNRFEGRCGCGPWRFVAVADDNGTTATVAADGNGDDGNNGFAELNYCTADDAAAGCANLTAGTEFRIDGFSVAAGCVVAGAFDRCVGDRTAAANVAASGGGGGGGGFRLLGGAFTPAAERGVITTVVLLVLCGFGAVCAVSAVTWLNARGYFIKLRSLLTPNGGGGGGGGGRGTDGGMACRTMSAHSLSPMSVHEYAELQRHKLGGSGDVGGEAGVRVIVYQDKGAQTVPEELTHEMLQTLRDKLDDPEDYAEARGMIEHLYDLIRVEETCCGGGGGGNRYGGGLDDMTSTITTKAVAVGPGSGRERPAVRSVATGTPSLDRLCPSKINLAAGDLGRRPKPPPPPPPGRRPSSVIEYADPADLLLYGGRGVDEAVALDDDDEADIYCELADLRADDGADGRHERHAPPPVPNKPTEV